MLLGTATGGILVHPTVALLGYLATYFTNPATAWWGAWVPSWVHRYSLILGMSTVVGSFIHRSKLGKFPRLDSQELLLIVLLGVIWLSKELGYYIPGTESSALKVTKFAIMLLIAGRLITNVKSWDGLVWVISLTGLYMGWEAFNAPPSAFFNGRLDGEVGGSDFNSSNLIGAHFASILPFIGMKFITSDWKGKVICFLSAGFVVNGIILCRSRGVFLGLLAGGLASVIIAKKEIRKKLVISLVIGAIGTLFLTDARFWNRITTISVDESQMDASAAGRLKIWRAALDMFLDNPLGVGEGNFKALVGKYNPAVTGKDTHNTFLRCMAELGVQGIIVLGLLILNAFKLLYNLKKKIIPLESEEIKQPMSYNILAVNVSLIITLVAGCFSSRLYMEEFYWLLMMPLFLKRVVETETERARGEKLGS